MFVINVKNTVLLTCVIEDLNSEEVVEMLYEQELKKQIKQSLELKKWWIIHIKWKGCDNSFNSLIDKNYYVKWFKIEVKIVKIEPKKMN